MNFNELSPFANQALFNYLPDHFEILIDIRGINPQNIRVNVTNQDVIVTAQQQVGPVVTSQNNNGQQTYSKYNAMSKSFRLPRPTVPEMTSCTISNDGSCMQICGPWFPL